RRMHERQIKETALGVRDAPIEAKRDRPLCGAAGDRIGLVGAGEPTKHVARKLIEHDDESERTLRRLLPCGELAVAGGVPDGNEASLDLAIEGGVLVEPFVRSGGAPENQDIVGTDAVAGADARFVDHSLIFPALISR